MKSFPQRIFTCINKESNVRLSLVAEQEYKIKATGQSFNLSGTRDYIYHLFKHRGSMQIIEVLEVLSLIYSGSIIQQEGKLDYNIFSSVK